MRNIKDEIKSYAEETGREAWNYFKTRIITPRIAKAVHQRDRRVVTPKFVPVVGKSAYREGVVWINYRRAEISFSDPNGVTIFDGFMNHEVAVMDVYHELAHHLQELLGWECDGYRDASEGLANFSSTYLMASNGMHNAASWDASKMLSAAEAKKMIERFEIKPPFGLKRRKALPYPSLPRSDVIGYLISCAVYKKLEDGGIEKMFLEPFRDSETVDDYLKRLT